MRVTCQALGLFVEPVLGGPACRELRGENWKLIGNL